MSERRDLPREDRISPVLCRVGDDTFDGITRNLSASGLFLETEWLFDSTQDIRVVLDIPGKGTIAATGRPTRVVARPKGAARYQIGVALRFLEANAEFAA